MKIVVTQSHIVELHQRASSECGTHWYAWAQDDCSSASLPERSHISTHTVVNDQGFITSPVSTLRSRRILTSGLKWVMCRLQYAVLPVFMRSVHAVRRLRDNPSLCVHLQVAILRRFVRIVLNSHTRGEYHFTCTTNAVPSAPPNDVRAIFQASSGGLMSKYSMESDEVATGSPQLLGYSLTHTD